MVAQVTAVISAIIAIVSLILSIKVYKRDTPKLHILISHPRYDCFFGDVILENNERLRRQRISGLRILLKNSSSSNIEVQSLVLRIKKESFRLIPNINPYWDNVTFITKTESGQEINFLYSIQYSDHGIQFPCIVGSYSFLEGYVLFYSFPTTINGKTHAQLIAQTAVGVVRKSVILREYNRTFEKQELEDVKQHYKSLRENDETPI